MTRIFVTKLFSVLFIMTASAQTDKAEADIIVYKMLNAPYQIENWHPGLMIQASKIKETAEKGIYILQGDSFQIKSLRSDVFIEKKGDDWTPVNDARYPLETMTNLLLNHIHSNQHQLELYHHQYGGKKPKIIFPMQHLFDLLARNMHLYCSVTFIDKNEIRAILVFHQQNLNFIHMLEVKMNTSKLTEPTSTITGDLYTNIPQNNVNNLFREKDKH